MSRYKGDNSGGYGNPPIKGQFQKGNKAGGRKKGSRSIDSAMRKVLRGDVTFRENGAPKTAAATDALAMRALQHGLSGSYRANEKMREVARTHGPQDDGPGKQAADLSLLSDEDLNCYARLAYKAAGLAVPSELVTPEPSVTEPIAFEVTVDGIHYVRRSDTVRSLELTSIDNRGYWSAALPRRYGCDHDWPQIDSEGRHEDR